MGIKLWAVMTWSRLKIHWLTYGHCKICAWLTSFVGLGGVRVGEGTRNGPAPPPIIRVITQSGSNPWGHCAVSRHIFGWRNAAGCGEGRAGMLLNIPPCAGRPPLQKMIWLQTSTVLRWRHRNLNVSTKIQKARLGAFLVVQ